MESLDMAGGTRTNATAATRTPPPNATVPWINSSFKIPSLSLSQNLDVKPPKNTVIPENKEYSIIVVISFI